MGTPKVASSKPAETKCPQNQPCCEQNLETKLNAADFFLTTREHFKEGIKNIMCGAEIRKITKELKNVECYRVPAQPFKAPLTLINSDFSSYGKELVKSYAQVFCNDFYRNYEKICFLCRHKKIEPENRHLYIDDSQHLLSRNCLVSKCTKSAETMAEIKLRISDIRPDSVMVSEVVDDLHVVRFLLNPSCITMGNSAISPEELQLKV